MSMDVTIHDCIDVKVEHGHSERDRWTDYTFTDKEGRKFIVTVFHQTARQALKGKLLEFVRQQDRFESSDAPGA